MKRHSSRFLIFLLYVIMAGVAHSSVSTPEKLIADDAFKDSAFGWAVAVDGNLAAVSAFADEDQKGAVYLYEHKDTGWVQVSKLLASQGVTGDVMGLSLAIDGETIAVGAPLDDNEGGTDAGAVYIFTKPADGWQAVTNETVRITSPATDTRKDRGFGTAIALKGDTLVVGAPGKGDALVSGDVFVFQGSGANWVPKARLNVPNLNGSDLFGSAVDFDGNTIVVGAFGQDNEKGAVYLFRKPVAGWSDKSYDALLMADDAAIKDYFGGSVAIEGDTIMVGANGDDDKGSKSGSVYLFTRSNGAWEQQPEKLHASDGKAVGNFGYSLDLSSNVLVVGASSLSDDEASDSVYIFTRSGEKWIQQEKLSDPDQKPKSKFGISVAIDETGSTIVVGAVGADAGSSRAEKDAGAAYLYQYEPPAQTPPATPGDGNGSNGNGSGSGGGGGGGAIDLWFLLLTAGLYWTVFFRRNSFNPSPAKRQ